MTGSLSNAERSDDDPPDDKQRDLAEQSQEADEAANSIEKLRLRRRRERETFLLIGFAITVYVIYRMVTG